MSAMDAEGLMTSATTWCPDRPPSDQLAGRADADRRSHDCSHRCMGARRAARHADGCGALGSGGACLAMLRREVGPFLSSVLSSVADEVRD